MTIVKKIALLAICNSVALIFLFAYLLFFKKDNVVYIDNQRVFEQFNMGIELKKKGEFEINKRSKIVDSLYALIQSSPDNSNIELLVKQFALQKEDLENFGQSFSNEQSTQIWGRIKNYAKEFSETNGYEIVLGSQSGDNIVYGADKKDVTSNFINFINEKYEGNK